jgi:hypothetical protein
MSVSRFHHRPSDGLRTFRRAVLSRPVLLLLVALRWYAIAGVAIAVYAFFHALR